MIETRNHGQLILASSYWGSEHELAGKLFVSVNAGAVRVLIPRALRGIIEECRASRYAILSRGPWPEMSLPDAVEILFEDGSQSPYALTFAPESFDLLPGEPDSGREWVVALWDSKKGRPHKALERLCHWRRVPSLPCLEPWQAQ